VGEALPKLWNVSVWKAVVNAGRCVVNIVVVGVMSDL
jgi:hypothetical protein